MPEVMTSDKDLNKTERECRGIMYKYSPVKATLQLIECDGPYSTNGVQKNTATDQCTNSLILFIQSHVVLGPLVMGLQKMSWSHLNAIKLTALSCLHSAPRLYEFIHTSNMTFMKCHIDRYNGFIHLLTIERTGHNISTSLCIITIKLKACDLVTSGGPKVAETERLS